MTSKSSTRNKSKRLLSHTRPALPASKTSTSFSSKTTRKLIRSHHTLHKKLRQAEIAGDGALATNIRAEIEEQGGLVKYQQASSQGQSPLRGGDSSKVLVEWLQELNPRLKDDSKENKLRYLEVGALRIDNACSRCGIFDVERIDLNSQHEGILQQDFMQRPLPSDEGQRSDRYDVISLSLVINYVPDPIERGEMLKRVSSFLCNAREPAHQLFPGLFLVLPSPCVTNSRYLDEQRLEEMVAELGYVMVKKKLSPKLVYYYFKLNAPRSTSTRRFLKKEVRTGGRRNNFTIVIQ